MVKYIFKRLGLGIFTAFAIMTICFVLVKSLPLVVEVKFGQDAELLEAIIEARGYRKPVMEQYFLYIGRIFQGDFGVGINMEKGVPVLENFLTRLPATMILNVYAMIFSIPAGLLLGIYAALKKNKWQDHVISTGVMIFISVPQYVFAFLVQYVLCFKGGLPLVMKNGTDWLSPEMFVSILAPVFSMCFGTIAGFTRYTRAELTEVLTSDFMLLARTKGLTKGQAVARHALRNAMVVIFPMIMSEFIGIIGSSIVIEQIFAVPGIGRLYLTAISTLDYDYFMFLSVFYVVLGMFAGIVGDISYSIVDPRIRMGER